MSKIKAEDIEYLALEGGGGKGIAFIGAIEALQDKNVLPIDIMKKGENQLKGISGTSAGSITAFCLAIGMESSDFREIIDKGIEHNGRRVTLHDFLDGPGMGQSRKITNGKPAVQSADARRLFVILGKFGLTFGLFIKHAKDLKSSLLVMLPLLFGPSLAVVLKSNAVFRKIFPQFELYLLNLTVDKGLFPGLKVREFFTLIMNRYLVDKIKDDFPFVPDGSILTFKQFKDFTGVDFVLTGTNITTQKPEFFSAEHTPDFPVVEAVGISMNIPFMYKPITIEGAVKIGDESTNKRYQGIWMDGGTLNNLPIHAFDKHSPFSCTGDKDLKPLHPGILALRLTNPKEPLKECEEGGWLPSLDELPIVGKLLTGGEFFGFIGDVLNTMMFHYPEEGQLRTEYERTRTIEIDTYCLATTEFTPPKEKTKKPIQKAKEKVMAYFDNNALS